MTLTISENNLGWGKSTRLLVINTQQWIKTTSYGGISGHGVCFWDNWSGCDGPFEISNKNPKIKGNSQ